MEFRRSTDMEFNRRILALKAVEIQGCQHYRAIETASGHGNYCDYHYYHDLDEIERQRDLETPLESLFLEGNFDGCSYFCIAAVHDDTVILVTTETIDAIRDRDYWEVWVAVSGVDKDSAIIRAGDRFFSVYLMSEDITKDSSYKPYRPRYVTVTPEEKFSVRGGQSFDGLVVEMGMLTDKAPDGGFLVMTTETFAVGDLKGVSEAEAIGVSDWWSWRKYYSVEKVRFLSIDGDRIRLSVGGKEYAFSCDEKVDIICPSKKGAATKSLIRIYATKDGLPLHPSLRDAGKASGQTGEAITKENVLSLRTFEVRGIPTFRTIFIRSALTGYGGSNPTNRLDFEGCPYRLDKLKGKSPARYGDGGPEDEDDLPAVRLLAVSDNSVFAALHRFDSRGNLSTSVIRIKAGETYFCKGRSVCYDTGYAMQIYTKCTKEERKAYDDYIELAKRCRTVTGQIAKGLERAEKEPEKFPYDRETEQAMLCLTQAVCNVREESGGMDEVRKAFEDYCSAYARAAGGFRRQDMTRAGILMGFFSAFPDLEAEGIARVLEEAESLSDAPDIAWLLGNLYEDGQNGSEKEKTAFAWYQKAGQKIRARREALGILTLDKSKGEYYDDEAATKAARGYSEEIRECLAVDLMVNRGLVRCYETMGDRAARFTTLLYMARECRGVEEYRLSMDVARSYEEGDGVEMDYDLALDWFDIADEHAFTDYPSEVAESLCDEVDNRIKGIKSTLKNTCRKLAGTLEAKTSVTKTEQAALSLAKAIVSEEGAYKVFERFVEYFLEEDGWEHVPEGISAEDDSTEFAEIRNGSFLNGFWSDYSRDLKIMTLLEDEAEKRQTPYAACLLGNLCESYPGEMEKRARKWYRKAREKAQAILNEADLDAKSRRRYEELDREILAGLERCEKALAVRS